LVQLVSSVTPTHEQMYRFLHLVMNIGEMAESLANIKTPSFVKLRWEARAKELLRHVK
jgi:hypothetical protein